MYKYIDIYIDICVCIYIYACMCVPKEFLRINLVCLVCFV